MFPIIKIYTVNIQLIMLICNEICVFHFEDMILIEYIYGLKSIDRILLYSSPLYLPYNKSLHYKLITSNWRLCGGSSIEQLNGFWNMKIFFALKSRSEKWCWNNSLSLEYAYAANLCGNEDFTPCFIFWQHGRCLIQLAIAYDLNNIGCRQNDCTIVFHI